MQKLGRGFSTKNGSRMNRPDRAAWEREKAKQDAAREKAAELLRPPPATATAAELRERLLLALKREELLKKENARLLAVVEKFEEERAHVLTNGADKQTRLTGQAVLAWEIATRARKWPRGKSAPEVFRAYLRNLTKTNRLDCGERSRTETIEAILKAVAPPASGPAPDALLLAKRALGAMRGKAIDPAYPGVRGKVRALLLENQPRTLTRKSENPS